MNSELRYADRCIDICSVAFTSLHYKLFTLDLTANCFKVLQSNVNKIKMLIPVLGGVGNIFPNAFHIEI
jgi:hypothetical protein